MKKILLTVAAALLFTACNPTTTETQSQPDAPVTEPQPTVQTSSMTEEPPESTPLDESKYSFGRFENATDDFILSLLRCPQYYEKYADATKIILTESDNRPLLVLADVGTFTYDGETVSYTKEITPYESNFLAEKTPKELTLYESEFLGDTRFSLLTNDIAKLVDDYYFAKIDYSAYDEKTMKYLENFFETAYNLLENTSGLQILDMNGDKNPEFVLHRTDAQRSAMFLFSSDSDGNVFFADKENRSVDGEKISPYRLYGGGISFVTDGWGAGPQVSGEKRYEICFENDKFIFKEQWAHINHYGLLKTPYEEYFFNGKKVSEDDYNALVKEWGRQHFYDSAFYIAETDKSDWTCDGRRINNRLAAANLLEKFFADSTPALAAEKIPKKGSVTYEKITPQPISFDNSGYISSESDYPEKSWLESAYSVAGKTEIYAEAAKLSRRLIHPPNKSLSARLHIQENPY